MITGIFKSLLEVKSVKTRLDDDFTDKISRRYSCILLFGLAAIVGIGTYFGEHIHCLCHDKKCDGNWEKYVNMYCWVHPTYYVPFEDKMPGPDEQREHMVTYYQWTSIILLTQALFFYLPSFLWRGLNRKSDINIGVIVEAARNHQKELKDEKQEKKLRYAIHLLQRYFQAQREFTTGCLSTCRFMLSSGRYGGNYLTFWYFVIKLLYLVNAIGQLFLLDFLLGFEFHTMGLHVVRLLVYGDEWNGSALFPKVTYCDVKSRQMSNVHPHTYQCLLPINMFNDKIFIIVWFWLFFVSIITMISFLFWMYEMASMSGQVRLIKRQLNGCGLGLKDQELVNKFAEYSIRRDGILVLKLISKNVGDVTATELLCGLYEDFISKNGPALENGPALSRDSTCVDLTNRKLSTQSVFPNAPPIDIGFNGKRGSVV